MELDSKRLFKAFQGSDFVAKKVESLGGVVSAKHTFLNQEGALVRKCCICFDWVSESDSFFYSTFQSFNALAKL